MPKPYCKPLIHNYSTNLQSLVLLILLTSCLRAGAISFTPEVISWETHNFAHKTILVESGEMEKWYCLGLPRGWSYSFQGPDSIEFITEKELAKVTMHIAKSSDNFPGFWKEEDLKHYARLLVSNLPEDIESRGEVRKGRPWIRYNNWSSLYLSVEYVQYGNKMKMSMGFSLNPENRKEQLRQVIVSRADDWEYLYKKLSNGITSWRLMDREERDELESGEIVVD